MIFSIVNSFRNSVLTTLLLGTFLFMPLSGASAKSRRMSKKPTRVVLIALDGVNVAGFEQANTPNLDAFCHLA